MLSRFLSDGRTRVIGHRGSPATAPENTLDSFKAAIAAGADAIECDVHLSADGFVMVMHDEALDRTTRLTGLVGDRLRAEMPMVPTLDKTLAIARDFVTIIELKGGARLEQAVIECVHRADAVDRVIYFSFDGERLDRIRSLEPGAFVTWLTSIRPTTIPEGINGLGVHWRAIDRHLVEESPNLFAWTVPVGSEAIALVEFGVRFVITDDPAGMIRLLTRS